MQQERELGFATVSEHCDEHTDQKIAKAAGSFSCKAVDTCAVGLKPLRNSKDDNYCDGNRCARGVLWSAISRCASIIRWRKNGVGLRVETARSPTGRICVRYGTGCTMWREDTSYLYPDHQSENAGFAGAQVRSQSTPARRAIQQRIATARADACLSPCKMVLGSSGGYPPLRSHGAAIRQPLRCSAARGRAARRPRSQPPRMRPPRRPSRQPAGWRPTQAQKAAYPG